MELTIITGNIGADAEVRTLESGRQAISFSLAVDKSYTDAQGQRVQRSKWFRCTRWVSPNGSTKIAQYLTKGKKVLVRGEVDARAWSNQTTGEPVASLELNVQDLELLGGGDRTQEQPGASAQNTAQQKAQRTTPAPAGSNEGPKLQPFPYNPDTVADEDLPF